MSNLLLLYDEICLGFGMQKKSENVSHAKPQSNGLSASAVLRINSVEETARFGEISKGLSLGAWRPFDCAQDMSLRLCSGHVPSTVLRTCPFDLAQDMPLRPCSGHAWREQIPVFIRYGHYSITPLRQCLVYRSTTF
jgi:hypothetical protein